ncbi:hypothetical protein [Pseudanabaena sp. ABRG5-3]|uniref:hypothetical protein n=1 Tax=Pseudanabaena sp. ABRG5-3 TaxID=685565 RepID=UPI000F82BC2F|nr:hypothetical protein [Pseudanabaena sp. ABRG5-3]
MQNTTFLDCVFRSVGIAGILTGYSFGALSPVNAETIPNLLTTSDISLNVSSNVGAKLHLIQKGDTLYSMTQMYQIDAAAIATSVEIIPLSGVAVDPISYLVKR